LQGILHTVENTRYTIIARKNGGTVNRTSPEIFDFCNLILSQMIGAMSAFAHTFQTHRFAVLFIFA